MLSSVVATAGFEWPAAPEMSETKPDGGADEGMIQAVSRWNPSADSPESRGLAWPDAGGLAQALGQK
jgi:hypothetical protein